MRISFTTILGELGGVGVTSTITGGADCERISEAEQVGKLWFGSFFVYLATGGCVRVPAEQRCLWALAGMHE